MGTVRQAVVVRPELAGVLALKRLKRLKGMGMDGKTSQPDEKKTPTVHKSNKNPENGE